ncbi:YhcU family protein [Falsibacillus albus]|uniref:YhcU family protein n=1 Tax=Falsibacillus albus TaxID=2478915 RepID=A0A3L7K317_9BACI|nr:YhcU family protein [Falsibacillus albus]RLQ97388.1 hypothetical protein D9X91_04345 [Falsibacillus albus]
MKILFASTHEQEEKISELINTFYTQIFPQYFSDEEIAKFHELKILHTTTRHFEYFGTLKEAFQVISCLQTIISILDVQQKGKLENHYQEVFERNTKILQKFGLLFPFHLEQFQEEISMQTNFSIYTKAANELLV